MRRLSVLRRYLECELSGSAERGGEACKQRLVIFNPVERRIRDDEIEFAARSRKRLDRAGLEDQPRASSRLLTLFEHASGSVDADRLPRLEPLVQQPRQLPRAAAEIDDAHFCRWTNEREQIEERLLALALEFVVLGGVPGIGHGMLNHKGHEGHKGKAHQGKSLLIFTLVSFVSFVVDVFLVERQIIGP